MLKRTLSILLLALLLFNAYGFYLVFITINHQAGIHLENQLDQGKYPRDQTILIKVPLYLPYQPDQQAYHRVDGELIIHGQYYNAVEHRIFRDTMYTVYVFNSVKTHLYQKVDEFFCALNQVPATSTPILSFWNNLLKEYLPSLFNHPSEMAILIISRVYPFTSERLPQLYLTKLTPPPKNLV